jgi:hypothetical protein
MMMVVGSMMQKMKARAVVVVVDVDPLLLHQVQ